MLCQLYLNKDSKKEAERPGRRWQINFFNWKEFLVTSIISLGQKFRSRRKGRILSHNVMQWFLSTVLSVHTLRGSTPNWSYAILVNTAGRGIITDQTPLCTWNNHRLFGCSIRDWQTVAHAPMSSLSVFTRKMLLELSHSHSFLIASVAFVL